MEQRQPWSAAFVPWEQAADTAVSLGRLDESLQKTNPMTYLDSVERGCDEQVFVNAICPSTHAVIRRLPLRPVHRRITPSNYNHLPATGPVQCSRNVPSVTKRYDGPKSSRLTQVSGHFHESGQGIGELHLSRRPAADVNQTRTGDEDG